MIQNEIHRNENCLKDEPGGKKRTKFFPNLIKPVNQETPCKENEQNGIKEHNNQIT